MRGQAALEFLTTYGWIIIGVIVVLGVLVYYGFLSPGNLLQDECTFSSQLSCEEALLEADKLSIVLRNQYSQDINITNIIMDNNTIICPEQTINRGRTKEFICTGSFSAYDRAPIRLTAYFIRSQNSSVLHNVSGKIVSSLQ